MPGEDRFEPQGTGLLYIAGEKIGGSGTLGQSGYQRGRIAFHFAGGITCDLYFRASVIGKIKRKLTKIKGELMVFSTCN
jgi:hypothetical protein